METLVVYFAGLELEDIRVTGLTTAKCFTIHRDGGYENNDL